MTQLDQKPTNKPMENQLSPEHQYLREVLGISHMLLPEVASDQVVQPLGESPGTSNEPERSLKIFFSSNDSESGENLVINMMSAIGQQDFKIVDVNSDRQEPINWSTINIVFGRVCFENLKLAGNYSEKVGAWISVGSGEKAFVLDGIDQMLQGPDVQGTKRRVWGHLKRLKGVIDGKTS